MDDSPEMRQCLICEEPTSECHQGIDACRACSVFYKRALKHDEEWFKCSTGANDCIEIAPTTSCRKCRYRKFCDVLAQSAKRLDHQETESETDSEKEMAGSAVSFLDHNSFTLIPASSSTKTKTSLLDRIASGYSLMCVIRRTGEEMLAPSDYVPSQEEMEKDTLHFFPMTYNLILPVAKLSLSALIDFAKATFKDFRSLSAEDKVTVVQSCSKFTHMLDCTYRTAHYFPDSRTEIATVGYTFTADNDDIDTLLADRPVEVNRDELEAVFRQNTVKLNELKEHFKRVAPSNAEFAMLFGLCFWSNEIAVICEPLTLIVERNRKAIMDELHSLYKKQGRLDYAARLGELYCLLANLEEVSTLADGELELYKLMNIFTEFGS